MSEPEKYPGNSNKKKLETERPKLKKVVQGTATVKEKTLGDKVKRVFFGPQIKTALIFAGTSIILPAIKDMAEDAVTSMIRGAFNGGEYGRGRRGTSGSSNFTNYSSYSGGKARKVEETRDISPRARANHDFSELVLESRAEGEMILDTLNDLIAQYGHATVSDMYDLAGVSGSFPDDKWGWYDLSLAQVRRTTNGYLLAMPRTKSIE